MFDTVMEVVIPNSLAEERFENLQLEAFFKDALDVLVSFAQNLAAQYKSIAEIYLELQ